jgi:hypothetical protein
LPPLRITTSSRKLSLSGTLLVFLTLHLSLALGQQPATSTPAETLPQFHLEVVPIASGGELLTIWARCLNNEGRETQIPLVSVLRDTLGDNKKENDLLRELWVHTYTRPSLLQRITALVPFLYKQVGNASQAKGKNVPPAIINLSDTEQEVWMRLFVSGATSLVVADPLLKISTHTYRQNIAGYRKANVVRALTVLSQFSAESGSGGSALTQSELAEIQARLMLSDRLFGGIVDQRELQNFYRRQYTTGRDLRGHNWELLRQHAESSGLYFEPLAMPDGSVTHAVLWVARLDLSEARNRPFDGRFLNIKNPWDDTRLLRWKGYSEKKYFDAENRIVSQDATGARGVEMIPLAVYGLDFPKIPILLIDFRDGLNPGKRELSRRLIDDVARVASVSQFGNLYYFAGRTAFDFVTGRRGIDFNQPSRVGSYAQLKLLLTLNRGISPGLSDLLSEGLRHMSHNPLENSEAAERQLANDQYRALLAAAKSPEGLSVRLERERSAEMTSFVHGRAKRTLITVANLVSLGLYRHREKMTPETLAQLNKERQLAYHTRFLSDAVSSTPVMEVSCDMDEVRRSIRYVAENGALAGAEEARLVARIFTRTGDTETRELCLLGLKMIGNKTATRELARVYDEEPAGSRWRLLCAEYLQTLPLENPSKRTEKQTAGVGGQQ